MACFTELTGRGVLTLTGKDRVSFLQGLVSNDVSAAAPGRAVWAALLTPQGKFRHDFFIIPQDDSTLLIDCEGGDRLMDLGQTLRRYVLRADVQLGIATDLACYAIWDTAVPSSTTQGLLYPDPRLPAMGFRLLAARDRGLQQLTALGYDEKSRIDWDALRIRLGIPDGARDMPLDKAILLENGFDELGGIDWQKGCYMGQELTARTKYRGLVKKRLLPVRIEGQPPAEGSAITSEDRDAGTLFSVVGQRGLALLRLDALKKEAPLVASGALLIPEIPDWVALPE